ncbi:DUF5801 domain-containing protein [Sulfitobacter sp. F26169L]|uniref:beta strand repeat-containing protein n=1 Tax=Sulfitobacter sp. F26169L TaxID=2996015 RepID=UPI002260EE41|nr:DUF5801 repeats-in-toxin domain-containing protein [Sulfitobacter sp. F26169L]MCX7566523.1 DUF5801 domain-containing protein [Sulfitobacter sp. F26169L]
MLLQVQARDGDGDAVTQSAPIGARISLVDDLPVAVDDATAIAPLQSGPAQGNVISGVGNTGGAGGDDAGADGAVVTQVAFGSVTVAVPASGNATIAGQYGTLSLSADGTYSYQRDPDTAGGVDDVFSYTLTDGDGDTATATLTVSLGDAGVSLGGLAAQADGGDALVNESGLPTGTGVGAGDSTGSGSFTLDAFDGIAALVLSQTGQPDVTVIRDGALTSTLSMTGGLGNTLSITGYNAATGEVSYTYTLGNNEDHAGTGRDTLFESFGITLTDNDGDAATGTLEIAVVDDIPVVTVDTTSAAALVTSDAALGMVVSQGFADLFDVEMGADGAAATTPLLYSLQVGTAGVNSGLTDMASGDPVLLYLEGGVVVGRAGGDTGPEVLRLTVGDAATGTIEMQQLRAVEHPDGAGANAVTLADSAVLLQVQARDGDGDAVTQSAPIGARISLVDDLPVADVAPDTGFTLPFLTTLDAETLAGTSTATANFAGALTANIDFGNDGLAATNPEVWAYELSLLGNGTSVSSGLSSEGAAITLYLIGGQVVGATATSAADVLTTNTIFTIEVAANGDVTLNQTGTIDHSSTSSNSETIALARNLVWLNGTVTVTDRDNDTDTASGILDIGDRFVFTDDGPTVSATPSTTVNETGLRTSGATLTATQTIGVEVGADRDGTPVEIAFASTQTALVALGLNSGGDPLTYSVSDGLITASAAGVTVFTVALVQPTSANSYQSSYSYEQFAPLDHRSGTTLLNDLTLPFDVTVTDGDGDSADTAFDVVVQDDAPTAVAQASISVIEGSGPVGSGAGGINLLDNDTLGADGARVHQISYNDINGDPQIITITPPATGTGPFNTQYGSLSVNADGGWSFTPNTGITHTGNAPVDGSFSYSLIDGDGDVTPFVAQPISIDDTAPVPDADVPMSVVENDPTGLSGDLIVATTQVQDGPATVFSFTYTDTSGDPATFEFTDANAETVQTLTGTLTVNPNGAWTFIPVDSIDHDGADADDASFSYVLVDNDGTQSVQGTQTLIVTDTDPATGTVALSLDEANLANAGSAGLTTGVVETAATSMGIIKGPDAIDDVVFTEATKTGLGTLTSGGATLVYDISPDGHTLIATAGAGGDEIFRLEIANATDPQGLQQTIKATLSGPLDHPAITPPPLNVVYEVRDIDSAVTGTATFEVVDDEPLAPSVDPDVVVTEGDATFTGTNLLLNDTLGADDASGAPARVYDFEYTDRNGITQTGTPGAAAVNTQYGALVVQANGDWSYTPLLSANHNIAAGNDLTLTDDFTYRTVDFDDDVSPASATQSIAVNDTEPTIGDPDDNTVSEANLPNGTAINATALTVTGSLDVDPGNDPFAAALVGGVANLPVLTSGGETVTYALTNSGRNLVAYRGTSTDPADRVFTLDLTNPTASAAGYTFTLLGAIDHGAATSLDLTFNVTVTDNDGDTDPDTFTITVNDDAPSAAPINVTVDEDSSFSMNTSADGTASNTFISQGSVPLTFTTDADGVRTYSTANGTVTVHPDGSITYTPAPNFSGDETFEFVTADGATITITPVNVTVTPIADEPTISAVDAAINTLEDSAVPLGLEQPVVTDDGTGTGNNPRPERIGAITLTGLPAGAKLLDGSGVEIPVTLTGGAVTVVLSDTGVTVNGATGDLTLTAAQYEALQVLPPEHASANFTVTASVRSYEVNAGGDQVGAASAPATVDVEVNVQAVTDDAALVFDTTQTGGTNITAPIDYNGGNTVADVTILEDTTFNLTNLLDATFVDLDGSEQREIVITNDSGHSIIVSGQTVANGASITLDERSGAAGQTGEIDSFAPITIRPASNVSGYLENIKVEIRTQDYDSDGWLGAPNNSAGVAEADTTNNSVTLNLRVMPVAGEVSATNSRGNEDTDIAFLAGVRVTDRVSGTIGGNEVITQVTFERPNSNWKVNAPAAASIWSLTQMGETFTINFTGGTQLEREQVLDGFTITPPAHSSSDATIALDIETCDTVTIDGTEFSDTSSVTRNVTITVDPVAEQVGVDSAAPAGSDVTMNGNYNYKTAGQSGTEDTWFELNQPGFDFAANWNNEDADELTYARITPVVTVGDPGDAIGSQFRWEVGGVKTAPVTFTGTWVDIPVSVLGSVEFLPSPDFAGQVRFDVLAYTEDFDDDAEGVGTPGSTAVSGVAVLSELVIAPVADDVSLTLTARVAGREDQRIPLQIRPSSSDDSETFNITIKDIPDGALIYYDGSLTPLVVTGGMVTIVDFDKTADLEILPPLNSNNNFDLTIEAVSVDQIEIDGTTITNISTPPATLPMRVAVKGVADDADVAQILVAGDLPTFTEAALDGGSNVALDGLVSVTLQDLDTNNAGGQSETLTVRVSGLPDGFSLTEGTLLSPPSVTGAARVWALNTTQFDNAEITVPANFSGTVDLNVTAVTTENDGDSRTGSAVPVSFIVTPSPEAVTTASAVLVEDQTSQINFSVVHVDGDTDEQISAVRIRVDDVSTVVSGVSGGYTLYDGITGFALSDPALGLTIYTDPGDGTQYYELSAAQAAQLSARAGPQADGDLGSVEIFYQVTDQEFGSDQPFGTGATSTPVTSEFKSVDFALTATPVTDAPDVTITAISGLAATTIVSDAVPDDDASPDTAALQTADTITVRLNVASPDDDGSERVIRVLITDVPVGVTVEDAQIVGTTTWLLVYDGADTKSIDPTTEIDVNFIVSDQIGAGENLSQISMSVQVQDRGDQADAVTDVLSDTVSWTLDRDFTGSDTGEPPATIVDWSYTGADAAEDGPFALSTMLNGTVSATSTTANTMTVQLTDLPAGTIVSGMTTTVIDGVLTWTASTTAGSGGAQAALDALLAGITITLPENSNDNNNESTITDPPGPLTPGFKMNATLTTSVVGGTSVEEETISPVIPVVPITDPATIEVTFNGSGPDGSVVESDTEIPISVLVTNPADGSDGVIIDGNLYLQIDVQNPGPTGGVLTNADGSTTYAAQTVSGVTGLATGDYYVIPGVSYDTPVDLVFTPATTGVGSITVDAFVQNNETGDETGGTPNVIVSSNSETQAIDASNDGVLLTTAPSSGDEVNDNEKTSVIRLLGLSVDLVDGADGSEELVSILLGNVPEGFLVVSGTSASDAQLAEVSSNAGGSGGLNTWVLTGENEPLPPYIAIQPPQNWSGTLNGLELLVTSGEILLDEKRTDIIALDPVTVAPVADGLELLPTNTFGKSNKIVPFNLNASINDAVDASVVAAPDEHLETATIVVTGLGEHASIYNGTTQLQDNVTYDAGTKSYTITGLTQTMIDNLGFLQAVNALEDQDAATSGLQIGISAVTVDASPTDPAGATSTSTPAVTTNITASITPQLATSADNSLLWTGQPINGLAGDDTIMIRNGENLTGVTLATNLTNVETLDLGVLGTNVINVLTPAQVAAMTDGDKELTIIGSSDDIVNLSDVWQLSPGPNVIYTSTIGTGPGATTVTLNINGGVQVNEVPTSLPRMISSAEPFNLASLDEADEPEADTSREAPDGLTLDDLITGAPEDDLVALLPQSRSGPESGTQQTDRGSETGDGIFIASRTWEEDPQDGLVFDS